MTEQVDFDVTKMKIPYVFAQRHNWEGFRAFFRENRDLLDKHIDLHQSTPFHYAAHSGRPRMYEDMLDLVGSSNIQHVLRIKDDMGNTPLHEVAFAGDLHMTRSILGYNKFEKTEETKSLVDMKNNLGETPVYRAAALGNTNLLKYFVEEKELGIDISQHFHREDKLSILHAAVVNKRIGTALWLLERYEELVDLKDNDELTTLQLLAKMPSTFKSQTQMGTFENFIYLLLPNYQDYDYFLQNKDGTRKGGDLDSGKKGRNHQPQTQRKLSAFSWMWYTMWKVLTKEWKGIEKLWRKKEMHKLAKELVYLLAEKDLSWRHTSVAKDRTVSPGSADSLASEPQGNENMEQGETEEANDLTAANKSTTYTPLLMATCNGIMEIVEVIIQLYPQSIEQVSEDEQNILHMAVKHRQLEIFRLLEELKMTRKLAGKIDKLGNTVLHYTADFHGGRQPGYALQLQEELHWFERIEKRLPYHYTIHCNKSEKKTARQLFMEKHDRLLIHARGWIKGTAQSCSAVSVLVATVVFAAAYTVPGGTDENGLPRSLHHPMFMVFTVMDVVSLASSLASVVMFLSILTSPCEMWDFRSSLPRKLMAGFALLFFSMATTMVSFSATVLININLEKNKWTSILAYSAAFLPVSIFAVMQFPLYLSTKGCVEHTLKSLKKITPRYFRNLLEKHKRKTVWEF